MMKTYDVDFYTRLRSENQRLGLLFGLVMGLGFSAAMWLPDALRMVQAQVEGAWLSLVSGIVLCLPLALLAGWLVGLSGNGLIGVMVWATAAVAMTWIAGHVPYEPQSWWISLLDPVYNGLETYPYGISAQARSVISMVVSAVIAMISGGMQPQVIDNLRSNVGLSRVSSLLVCMVFFVGAGWAGNLTMYQPLREPLIAMDDLFQTAERYQGQELSASERRALRLNTLRPIQDLLDQPRRLYLGNFDPQSLETTRVNLTLGEEWVSCMVLAGQPLFCQKSSELYGKAFYCLWQNQMSAESGCELRITPGAQSDLTNVLTIRGVSVVSQIGRYSMVKVFTTGEHQAYLCRILETPPRTLEGCQTTDLQEAPREPQWLVPTPAAEWQGEGTGDLGWIANQPHYNLAVALDPANEKFSGEMTLVYTNTQTVALEYLLLRLLPNGAMSYGNGALRVAERVTVNGEAVSPRSPGDDPSQLLVLLPDGLMPGEQVSLALTFEGAIPIDFGGDDTPYAYGIYNLSKNVLALASWYPILAVFEDGAWRADPVFPIGDSVFSETAFYRVEITAPAVWQVAATGVLREQSPAGEGYTAYTYEAGPVRDFFIAASPDFQVLSGVSEGVAVHAYYLPGSEEGAAQALTVGKQAIESFTARFGEYPDAELDIVQAPMRKALGVEYPGIVLIGAEGYKNPEDPAFHVTVAHEVAHQWWYNVVGNDVFREPWLDEGLTTFSSAVYYEDAAGNQAYEGVRAYWQDRYDKLLQEGRDVPLGWSLSEFMEQDPEAYAPIAYSKGALFFDALRDQVGDAAFFTALSTYYREQQFAIASGDDLRAAFIQAAGPEVEALFDEWFK